MRRLASGRVATIKPPTTDRRPGRALAPMAAVAGVGLGLAVTILVVVVPLQTTPAETWVSRLAVGAFAIGMTGLTLVGALLWHRRPGHRMALLLVATGVTALASRLVAGAAGAALVAGWPLPDTLLWATNWAWVPAQAAAMLVLMRFPDGELPRGRGWRPIEWAVLAWAGSTLVTTALLPGPLGQTNLDRFDNPYGAESLGPLLHALLGPLFAVLPALVVASALSLVWRWRRSADEARQQLRWVAVSALLIAGAAPFAVAGGVPELVLALAFVVFPGAIAVAVLRRGLWSLGLVVRRSVVYAVAVSVLGLGYIVMVSMLDSRATPVVAGLIVALLAVPLRDLVERGLDQLLYGDAGDPDLVVRALSRRLAEGQGPVVDEVVAQLQHSLRLPYVAVTSPDGRTIAASPLTPTAHRGDIAGRVPLRFRGEDVGWLLAQERAPGEGLGPRDLDLLSQVARQAGLAVRLLNQEQQLRAVHARMLAVRSQERARLQRDLHDGLGPTLGAVSMRAEAARNLLASGSAPEPVDQLLAQIGHATEGAIAEIRRLIADLRPTSLEEHGLRRALRDLAADTAAGLEVRVVLPDGLPPLRAPAEVALYRIAAEALRNVVRHAQARTCSLALSVGADAVVLEVVDDGVGTDGVDAGVGLRSMRERAEAVGGDVEVIDTGQGTVVRAVVPWSPS